MKTRLMLGFVLSGSTMAADSPVLTIQVSNQAEVDSMTLILAERTATGIFKKTGVESRWIEPAAGEPFPLSHIQLKIVPGVISLRGGLPDGFPDSAMGLAPGNGPDRQSVYVFYDRVKSVHAVTAQILGHAIAHEIGHVLLNDQSHSAAGIMRGEWNLWDLQNASYGYLLFTSRQAKAIREEAGRRVRQPQEKRGSLTKKREEVP